MLESIKSHETGDEAEIVFPSLPPAFVDTKESDRGIAVELKRPTSLPRVKKFRMSGCMRRRKKEASRMPPSRMCLSSEPLYLSVVLSFLYLASH
jgi:hypothetical protein